MNESISYAEFSNRFAPHLWGALNQADRDRALTMAWEECAWNAQLTEQRGKQALESAMRNIFCPTVRRQSDNQRESSK